MSVLVICTVRDSAANLYNRPFYVPNVNLARRSLQDQLAGNQPGDETIRRHPEDFELYELGFFEEETAKFELHPSPKLVVRAKDLVDPT